MARLVLALAVLLAPLPVSAQDRTEAASAADVAPEAEEAPSSPSASVGVPDRGRLRDGRPLGETAHLFVRVSRRAANFGTAELVGLIERAADAVYEALPGPKLVVGDLSRLRGGRNPPHRSHQSGRDADIGFYLLDGSGQSTQPDRFVSLRRDGCGTVREDRFCFDTPRNWALLASMVQDEGAQVQYVLIAPDIRRRLLEEGARQGAPAELVDRVSLVTEPHSGSHSHRSHFHVRIYCPVDDRPACIDEPPYHPWYEGAPAPPTPRCVACGRGSGGPRRASARRPRVAGRLARRRAPRRLAARLRAARGRAELGRPPVPRAAAVPRLRRRVTEADRNASEASA
ncbi:MAG: penicillin-insensitive murein endopeptidase [Sandaracinaceae bacterium]|nr:penicillin-insensitive murein endopeptidase [Sandaracinaceae bacterium]